MEPIQIVIDTNVIVSAVRSIKGASYEIVLRIGDPRWELNVSTALMLEYEARLKIEMLRQDRGINEADDLLDFIASTANRRRIPHVVRRLIPDKKDDFILELAIASGAAFIVTYNIRDFIGADSYGVRVVTPGAFLRLLEVGP